MAFAESHADRYGHDGTGRPQHPGPTPCDTAIGALEDALAAIARDDIAGRCNAVSAATEAVTSLFLELDLRNDGALAQSAGRLYGAVLARLVRVNLDNDPDLAREAIELLEPLRNAWLGAHGPGAAAQAIHRSHP